MLSVLGVAIFLARSNQLPIPIRRTASARIASNGSASHLELALLKIGARNRCMPALPCPVPAPPRHARHFWLLPLWLSGRPAEELLGHEIVSTLPHRQPM